MQKTTTLRVKQYRPGFWQTESWLEGAIVAIATTLPTIGASRRPLRNDGGDGRSGYRIP